MALLTTASDPVTIRRRASCSGPASHMGLLSHDAILKVHAAVLTASLTESRMALLAGIDSRIIAGLPHAASPSDHILRDLDSLNATEMLADGAVPLALWITNAIALAGPRMEAAVFRTALARCQVAERPQPALRLNAGPASVSLGAADLAPAVAASAPKRKVLWVDDDPYALLSMSFWLTDRGREVLTANTPDETIQLLESDHQHIGCAIIDLCLPGSSSAIELSGLRLARTIKRDWPEIQLFCLSSVVSASALEWFGSYGAGYFHKHELATTRPLFLRAVEKAMTGRPSPPRTLVIHGQAQSLCADLKGYLAGELGWTDIRMWQEIPSRRRSVVQKFSDEAQQAELVVLLLSPEDATFASADQRSSQGASGLVFELGYFLGSSKRQSRKMIVLTTAGAALPLSVDDIVVIDATAGLCSVHAALRSELEEWFE